MKLTITVKHDRDESCNDYTLTRTVEIGLIHAAGIKVSTQAIMDLWRNTYPHKGRTPHTPVVDVVIEDNDDIIVSSDDEPTKYTERAPMLDDPRDTA